MNPFAGFAGGLGFSSAPKHINEVWRLLNETAFLVSRTSVSALYEGRLGALRNQLQNAPGNAEIIRMAARELVELRRRMRLEGYDLSMGKYTLVFDGFRNDDSCGEGFARAVLFIDDNGMFYTLSGEANHITLCGLLQKDLERHRKSGQEINVVEMHCIWFQRSRDTYIISGAATETAADYELLKKRGQEDNLLFLSRIKGLR